MTRQLKIPGAIFLAALVCLTLCNTSSAAISPESLRAAADYSRARRGFTLIVMQHDKVIFEDYGSGGGINITHKIYSGTKSFWVTAMLAAAHDGILSLDERVSETIPAWRSDLLKRNITIRQLMNFTDGIDAAFQLHGESIHDRNGYALRVPVVARPGSAFIYGPSHGQILCEVLKRKLASRGETPYQYLQHKVLDPLGLGNVEHKEDVMGNPLIATGFRLTGRQWLKFGWMLLHHGMYGHHEIVPPDLLAECFHGTSANPGFGMGLWLNTKAASPGAREFDVENMLDKKWRQQDWRDACICRAAPPDMVVALGSGYQRLCVIPSLDLIIVRQGENTTFSDGTFLRILLGR